MAALPLRWRGGQAMKNKPHDCHSIHCRHYDLADGPCKIQELREGDKFTPGEWVLSRHPATTDTYYHAISAIAADDGRSVTVATVYPISDDGQIGGESNANARLIVAAPELLSCLREVLNMAIAAGGLRGDDVQYGLGPSDWIDGMDRAIKTIQKARGVL